MLEDNKVVEEKERIEIVEETARFVSNKGLFKDTLQENAECACAV